jgi:hypothetical protein
MKRQLETFIATCIAVYRHLTRRHTIVAGAVSITALGCLQEDVISNMFPEDVDFDEDGVAETVDCDDNDPSIGAATMGRECDEIIENCSPCEPGCDSELISCNPIPDGDLDGYFESDDCDDSNPLIHPDASYDAGSESALSLEALACELGTSIDSDCDGEPDHFCVIVNPPPNGDLDMDMDGYFDAEDCDDTNPLIHPDASYDAGSESAATLEALACDSGDSVDADCDGEPDYACIIVNPPPPEFDDLDGDGYPADIDCNDDERFIHPNAVYEPGSEGATVLEDMACETGVPVDADCDNEPDHFCIIINPLPPELEDMDGDGYNADVDCNDNEPLIHPDASYAPGSNEAQYLENLACQTGFPLDANCDRVPDYHCIIINPPPPDLEDRDMDNYTADVDCDDTSALIYPGAQFRPESEEAFLLRELACDRGEAIDADCDGEAEIECIDSIDPMTDGDERE